MRRARSCAGRACTPATSSSGGGPGTPAALAGLARPRGRPRADPRDAQIARLRKEKAKLEQELAKARFVVDVQAKLQALLETISESADTEPRSNAVTDEAIAMLAPRIGTRAACAAAGAPQASWYRRHRVSPAPPRPAAGAARATGSSRARWPAAERQAILDVLH